MSRMFKSITKTWNVWVGCDFNCTYCNARKAALTRFKHIPRYKDGFKPHLVESELKRTFKPGQFIFVGYMGDIAWSTPFELEQILERIRQFHFTNFLMCSKDPGLFNRYYLNIPPNVYLGTTIETNRDYKLTKAIPPIERFNQLARYLRPHKFISIEPICDFDLDELTTWMREIQPEIIEIGADAYGNNLPEPPWWKVEALLKNLRAICPTVVEKVGLDRLKRGDQIGYMKL